MWRKPSALLTMAVGSLAATSALCAEVPDSVRVIIEKCRSFGIGGYPTGFWSYTNLKEHGDHMTEEEVQSWADAGFTVPQSPRYDPSDPGQKAHAARTRTA